MSFHSIGRVAASTRMTFTSGYTTHAVTVVALGFAWRWWTAYYGQGSRRRRELTDRKRTSIFASVATLLFLADCTRGCRSASLFDSCDFFAYSLAIHEEITFKARQLIPVEEDAQGFGVGALKMPFLVESAILFEKGDFCSVDMSLLIRKFVLELRHVE